MQQYLFNRERKVIYLDIYVDESKERKYNDEKIDYIMLMAIPVDKKQELYNLLNNSRCLSEEKNNYGKCCINKCKFHDGNNTEIHYNKIKKERENYRIADRWIDILLDNNMHNKNMIYFNTLGIIESNLDRTKFGDDKQFGNIYCRFFRTALLRLIRFFDKYDKIVINNIYHDYTNEMENHPYFNDNAIKTIRMEQLFQKSQRVIFRTDRIKFIDSDHRKSGLSESQFIQFVDLILGLTCNVIHDDAENEIKKRLTRKIYPLISRILDKSLNKNKNSRYNYYNKQSISFFPVISDKDIKIEYGKYTSSCFQLDDWLKNTNYFSNSKTIKFNPYYEQCSFFD